MGPTVSSQLRMTDFLRNFFITILFTLRIFDEVAEEIFFIFRFAGDVSSKV